VAGSLDHQWFAFFQRLLTQPTELPDHMAKDMGARVQKIYSVNANVEFGTLEQKMPAWGVPGETATVEVTSEMVAALSPKKAPMGADHHTDAPLTDEDVRIGGLLAYDLGTLFADVEGKNSRYWYHERTSIDEWSRVARALRIHGLMVVNANIPLVSDGELAAVRERDEARRSARFQAEQGFQWALRYGKAEEENIALRAELQAAHDAKYEASLRVARLTLTLEAKDARIAELDTLLAQRPAPVPDTPKPAHDPFREFSRDRRMIGR
jgi:hypothetical protein